MRARHPRTTIGGMQYALPPLPYSYDALAPTIDELTMRVHHGKHHESHVASLNEALTYSGWAGWPLEELLANLAPLPVELRAVVRDSGGAHANHSLFWESMTPNGGGDPSGPLAAAIDAAFGSVSELRRLLGEAGTGRPGSGWAWLVHDGTGLAVTFTANQDSPLIQRHTPLLGIDLWEHAYYLKHQHRRADYLEAWWNVVDWERVAERYAKVGSGR
jgi:superoxide dismutase, Fe-Mn family